MLHPKDNAKGKVKLLLIVASALFGLFAYLCSPQATSPKSSLQHATGTYSSDARNPNKYWELATIKLTEGEEIQLTIPRKYAYATRALKNKPVSVYYETINGQNFAQEVLSIDRQGLHYEEYVQDVSRSNTVSHVFRLAFTAAAIACLAILRSA